MYELGFVNLYLLDTFGYFAVFAMSMRFHCGTFSGLGHNTCGRVSLVDTFGGFHKWGTPLSLDGMGNPIEMDDSAGGSPMT